MSTNLRVAELDFDLIKGNLKTFLGSKPEFTDYDYEGSGLSVLIDLLAYNTHYNAVIGNMLIQELYLDTAVKKQSLSLISKRLGYTPKGYRSASAVVTVEVFPTNAPAFLTLGKNAKFSAKLNTFDTTSFVTRDAITIPPVNGRYIFENVPIFEGDNTTFSYIVPSSGDTRFEIPTEFVDTSLLRVYVRESSSSTVINEWKSYSSIIDVKSDTEAYFLKLNENLRYEVYFGDGVIGKQVQPDNVVVIDYVSTNGLIGNNIKSFQFNDTIGGTSNIIVTTVTDSYGGSNPESLDSIRRNAQNTVLLQNRAVTESDYRAIIEQIIPVETIAVYGGETMVPAQYGKVFISVKQTGTTSPLSFSQKESIVNELKQRSVMSLVHEFIDPDYIYLEISPKIVYDQRKTTQSATTLNTKIFNSIQLYGVNNFNKFDVAFPVSNLIGYIDDIDTSIISNDTGIVMRREVDPIHNIDYQYTISFYTGITPSNSRDTNVVSNTFRLNAYPTIDAFFTDVNGIITVYHMLNNVRTVLVENVGTIDYTTGKIEVTLNTSSMSGDTLVIKAVPSSKTLIPGRNCILTLLDADIKITLETL